MSEVQIQKKPSWLKVKFPSHKNFFYITHLLKEKNLHTICQSAKCPNISQCWTAKTATFLILGDICTRNCAFCSVKKGRPQQPDSREPQRVAEAAASMGLRYVVVTSVTRDDLPDGGASLFVSTILALKKRLPGVKVEVLIPDFKGKIEALKRVIEAEPEIINHNLEVPFSLYPQINRPEKNYYRSLNILKKSKEMGAITKSGLMVGLGETKDEIIQALADLQKAGCELLTIGQYLQPTKFNATVHKYYSPQEFMEIKEMAFHYGFKEVEAGPLVRSSYQAHKM
ncbi:MAG: lipoyl synthase, partial [Candidatus Aminicenantales bacterium]